MTETKLTAAAVYRSGCIVKRTGRVHLQAGTQQITLSGLSRSVDESSLRLSVPEGVSGSNVQVEQPTREAQEEALKELQKKISAVKAEMESLEKMAALWETNADFSQKESLSIGEMTDYLEKLPERLKAISAELDTLKEQKTALERELTEARKQAAKPHVAAELFAAEEGDYPVELTYRDHQAFWNPVYEIHTEDGTDALKLRMRAQITQNTGEDWEDAVLTLFSGNPSVSGTIPELRPSHIRFYEQRRRFTKMAAGGREMALARSAAAEPEEDEMVMEETGALMAMNTVMAGYGSAVKGETMTEYDLSGSWSIRSGQEIICDIRTETLPCRYHVVAVPKLSDEAYLAAEVDTADLEEMQDTPAAVYLKGTFAGNVTLEPDMTKEKYDLSLGVDETIRIKREQKKRHTTQVLLKGQKKTEYEYEITAASRKEKEISVTIMDQLPVSDEKTIVVEPLELSGAEREEKTDILRWTFPLAAGAAKTIRLSYTVAWPKDKLTEEMSM